MVNDELQEWKKKKIIQGWTSRFKQAAGNNKEWQKIFHEYLKSDIWKEKRKPVLIRANGKCEKCGAIIFDPDVHHINYDRVGGNETMDDFIVLCFSCHRETHKQRDIKTDERRSDAYYQARLSGFATKKYGDIWWFEHDKQDVEIEFIIFLYRNYCQEYGIDFDPNLDPESDFDFIEFWNQVLNGHN